MKIPFLPPIAGGQDVDEVLKSIASSLEALEERKKNGEQVDDEIAKLRGELDEAKKQITPPAEGEQKPAQETPEQELARLRAEKSEGEERAKAQEVVRTALGALGQQEEQRQERIKRYAAEAVAEALGGSGDVDEAIRKALTTHGGSRFVGQSATQEIAEAVAAGGTSDGGVSVKDPASLRAGAHNEAKKLMESKKLSLFMRAAFRVSKGWATDGEREFIMEARQKALSEGTSSAGGYLIPPDWAPDVLRLLRGVAVVRRANPRIWPLNLQTNQVAMSGGATAYYTAENAVIPTSQEAFNQVALLTPHNLTGLVPVSDWLLSDSVRSDEITDDAEDLVRQDLATVLGLREDLAFLQGSGSSGEPLGLKNKAGVTLNPIAAPAAGFNLTLPQLRQVKNYTRRMNVPNPRWVWFFHTSFLSYLEGLTDSLGRFLADAGILTYTEGDDSGWSGVIDKTPFFCSNQIPINLGSGANQTYLLLVNMNEAVVGQNQEFGIDVSSEASYTPDGGTTWVSAFQSNQTLFKAVLRHDIAHRYESQVLVQNGVIVS